MAFKLVTMFVYLLCCEYSFFFAFFCLFLWSTNPPPLYSRRLIDNSFPRAVQI
jgi:hypothetical protein